MNKSSSRARRVAEQLRRELAAMILQEIKDPRVRMVSLSGVEVSRDFSHAKIFVSVLGDEKAVSEAIAGLEHAAGFLRRELGRRMHVRVIPHLHFVHDTSIEQGAHIEELLAQAARTKPASD